MKICVPILFLTRLSHPNPITVPFRTNAITTNKHAVRWKKKYEWYILLIFMADNASFPSLPFSFSWVGFCSTRHNPTKSAK